MNTPSTAAVATRPSWSAHAARAAQATLHLSRWTGRWPAAARPLTFVQSQRGAGAWQWVNHVLSAPLPGV